MNNIIGLGCAFLSLAAGTLSATCDWPTMNHDQQNTRSNPCETVLNVSNVGSIEPLWSFASPGVGNGILGAVLIAPIVVNDIVYFGDLAGNFYGKNLADGSAVYQTFLPGSIQGAPTVYGDTLYIATSDLVLHALNLDLTPKWTVVVDPVSQSQGQAKIQSAPVLAGDGSVVIVGISSNDSEQSKLPPVLHGTFSAFDTQTGQFLWRTAVCDATEGACGGSWSTAGVDDTLGMIYVGTTNATTPPAGQHTDALIAIDYSTGEIMWSRQYTPGDIYSPLYPCGDNFDFGASPNLFSKQENNPRSLVGGASKEGIYRAYRRNNGGFAWSASLIPVNSVPSTLGNPGGAYANGVIYAAAGHTTSTLPQSPLGILTIIGNPATQAAAAALVGQIVAQTSTTISALDANNGNTIWGTTFPGPTFASITEANGVIYTANYFGILRALHAETGAVLFNNPISVPNYAAGTQVGAPMTVTDGKVIIATSSFATLSGGIVVYSLPQPKPKANAVVAPAAKTKRAGK